MYELTETKPRWKKILLGIGLFLLVSSLIKEFLADRKISFNDELIKMANEINKHAPITVDSTTRFDNMVALPGNKLQYNYTILTVEKKDIDTNYVIQTGKELMINNARTNPKFALFRDNKVALQAVYSDKNGFYLCTISIAYDDYKQ